MLASNATDLLICNDIRVRGDDKCNPLSDSPMQMDYVRVFGVDERGGDECEIKVESAMCL